MLVGPFIRINGNPLLLLNVVERRFSILGQLFWPQDSAIFVVALLLFALSIVLFTTAFGRLWCGWTCPQTLLMEMVFRKIEYAIVPNLKRAFGTLLHRRTRVATFLLGAINGLLPCGLVYVAAAAALATGSFETSLLYMLAFGVGTLPMMLGIASARHALKWIPGRYAQKPVPACVAIVAFLLVLRGMSLGIPYLSPNLANATAAQSCH